MTSPSETVPAVVLRVEDEPAGPEPTPRRGFGVLARLAWRLTGLARAPLAAPAALAGPIIRAVAPAEPATASLRHGGRDVTPEQLAAAYDGGVGGAGRHLVLVPPPGRDERVWESGGDLTGATYAGRLEELLGWRPVHVRVGDGDAVEQAVALSGLLQRYVDALASPPERIVLLGYAGGGLLARNALGVETLGSPPWTSLVTELLALGTAPYGVSGTPMTRGVGRRIDEQLAGIAVVGDAVVGLEPRDGVDYLLVTDAATGRPNPVGRLLGELLWWRHKAPLRSRRARDLFPTAERFEIPTGDSPLSNHPDVHDALLRWLA